MPRILQIVHISDLHHRETSDETKKAMKHMRKIARAFAWLGRLHVPGASTLHKKFIEGPGGHAPSVLLGFRDRLSTLVDEWKGTPTWLLNTGDLTALGDRPSLDAARSEFNLQRTLAGGRAQYLLGNHDYWPRILPALAHSEIAPHTAWLEKDFAPPTPPDPAIGKPLLLHSGPPRIELYSLQTVLDGAADNSFAYGRVDPNALDALVASIAASPRPSLRILMSHHPFDSRAYDLAPFEPGMTVKNGARVSTVLRRGPGGKGDALIHILLAGHTHSLYPRTGSLRTMQGPVGGFAAHLQLVTPSLSQEDELQERPPRRRWGFQVLRFSDYPPRPESAVRVERLSYYWENDNFARIDSERIILLLQ